MFNNKGLFVKEIKQPEISSDGHWLTFSMCAGPRGELVSLEHDSNFEKWMVYMRDADCSLLWSVEKPELADDSILMDYQGRLFRVSDYDVQIWSVEQLDVRISVT